jgi:RNA polymerase sigma-70 factor (ECF subfamily)
MAEEVGFDELYRTHYARVHGLCRRLLGSVERAEDAAQEVFVRAHRGLHGYDRAQPFAGWILRIATNYCIDSLRRRSKEKAMFGTESDERSAAEADDTDVLSELLTDERARQINAAVAELPERYRVPLVLAYYRESSYDDIAAALGITKTHVGTLVFRAKQMLRRSLQHMEKATQCIAHRN